MWVPNLQAYLEFKNLTITEAGEWLNVRTQAQELYDLCIPCTASCFHYAFGYAVWFLCPGCPYFRVLQSRRNSDLLSYTHIQSLLKTCVLGFQQLLIIWHSSACIFFFLNLTNEEHLLWLYRGRDRQWWVSNNSHIWACWNINLRNSRLISKPTGLFKPEGKQYINTDTEIVLEGNPKCCCKVLHTQDLRKFLILLVPVEINETN